MQQKYVDGNNGLGVRQLRVLAFLQRYNATFDYSPTVREIRDSLGISSTSVVGADLSKLEAGGYIERRYKAARTVKLTKDGHGLLWEGHIEGHNKAPEV